MKFEEIKSSEIKNGLLLDESQVNYLTLCIKEALVALGTVQATLLKKEITASSDSSIYLKKLSEELTYCVTILREEDDL